MVTSLYALNGFLGSHPPHDFSVPGEVFKETAFGTNFICFSPLDYIDYFYLND